LSRDIEIVVPGNTAFAGTYRGGDEAYWWLLTMRRAFRPAEQPMEFCHNGNDLVLRQVAQVGGRLWMNIFRFRFDGRLIQRIAWEPEDIETFDALIEEVIDAGDKPIVSN
jgi:hypothetical protein